MSLRDGNPQTPEPANVLTDLFQNKITQPVLLNDNSLRDGEQAPEVVYSLDEKLALASALDDLGVRSMTVGFPAVSAAEKQCVKEIIGLKLKAPRLLGMARLLRSDIDTVLDCGAPWLSTFVGTSDSHLFEKLKMSEEKALAQMAELIPYAKSCGLRIQFGFEDATRTPLRRLLRFIQAAEDLGVDTIGIADTVGILTPTTSYRLFSLLRPLVRGTLGCHVHNDLGMATANALAALEAGADLADCTLLGIGERTGNTPLEELAVILRVKYGIDLGFQLDLFPQIGARLAQAAKLAIPKNKPIVGEHAFSHESGIHVHGILVNPVCYEPFPPELLGRSHRFIYGKHSGLASIEHLLVKAGIKLPVALQQELLARVKATAQCKQLVSEQDVLKWAESLCHS